MNPLSIALGYIFALWFCSGTKQPDKYVLTLNDFTDELLLYWFSLMPASQVARNSSVSQRFNTLSCMHLRRLFNTRQEDGGYTLDLCKIYQHYHEVEPSLPIKLLTLQTINAGRPTCLSGESFRLNKTIDCFTERLFYDGTDRIHLHPSIVDLNHDLTALLLKYQDSAKFFVNLPTEKLIDTVGEEKLRSLLDSELISILFLRNRAYIKGGLSYRKKLYKLHQAKLTKFLQTLIESGDVFDKRLLPVEIGTIDLIALADYSMDGNSLKRALDLADEFIRRAELCELVYAIQCIGSTRFVIKVLQKIDFSLDTQKKLGLIIYLKKGAKTIFNALNDIDAIRASMRSDDDAVDIFLKILFGILNGVGDSILLPLCDVDDQSRLILGAIAAYHERSHALLLALTPNQSIEPLDIFYSHDLLKTDSLDYAKLDFGLEKNISLLKVGFFPYWNFITVPKRIEYLEHLLDSPSAEDARLGLDLMSSEVFKIGTDQLYRKYIKCSIINGQNSISGIWSSSPVLLNEIAKEVMRLLQSGIDYSKMFAEASGNYYAGSLRSIVFQAVLSWKNGFALALQYIRNSIKTNAEINDEAIIVYFFKICIVSNFGFDIPSRLEHLIFAALKELVEECKLEIGSISKACKLDPIPSSFHRAFAETIASPECAALLTNYQRHEQ